MRLPVCARLFAGFFLTALVIGRCVKEPKFIPLPHLERPLAFPYQDNIVIKPDNTDSFRIVATATAFTVESLVTGKKYENKEATFGLDGKKSPVISAKGAFMDNAHMYILLSTIYGDINTIVKKSAVLNLDNNTISVDSSIIPSNEMNLDFVRPWSAGTVLACSMDQFYLINSKLESVSIFPVDNNGSVTVKSIYAKAVYANFVYNNNEFLTGQDGRIGKYDLKAKKVVWLYDYFKNHGQNFGINQEEISVKGDIITLTDNYTDFDGSTHIATLKVDYQTGKLVK